MFILILFETNCNKKYAYKAVLHKHTLYILGQHFTVALQIAILGGSVVTKVKFQEEAVAGVWHKVSGQILYIERGECDIIATS